MEKPTPQRLVALFLIASLVPPPGAATTIISGISSSADASGNGGLFGIVEIVGQRDCAGMFSAACGNLDSLSFHDNGFGNRRRGDEDGLLEVRGGPRKATPKAENNSNKNSEESCKSTANPVVIASGEKHKEELDFAGGGIYGLRLQRTYRSQHATGTLFGKYWLSSLDGIRLAAGPRYQPRPRWPSIPKTITAIDTEGTKFLYEHHLPAGGRTAKQGEPARIDETEVPDVFTYRVRDAAATGTLTYSLDEGWHIYRNKKSYVFGAGLELQSVTDRSGSKQTYTYTSSFPSRLESITNEVGQRVHFTWGANGHVSEVRDPAGNIWRYVYDGNGMLSKVTAPASKADVREYHYEDKDPTLLTGISIGGQRYSRYTYHADQRVAASGLTGGEENDNFVYDGLSTTVTDARGQVTRYQFADVGGELKIAKVARTGTPTCGAANAQTAYDANGFLDYTLDFNGNKTDYTYDNQGKLLATTGGADTAEALTTSHSWSGDDITETIYQPAGAAAYAKATYSYHVGGRERGRLAGQTITDLTTGAQRQTRYRYAFRDNGTLAHFTIAQVLAGGDLETTVQFDTLGNISAITNPLKQTLTWPEYDGLGMARKLVDENAVATSYTFNPDGTLATTTETGNRVTSIAYNAARQPVTVSYPDGSVARYGYTPSGRLDSIGNALGEFVSLGVDMASGRISRTSPRNVPLKGSNGLVGSASGAFSATTELDSMGRPYAVLGKDRQRVDIRHDGNGNVVSRTNAAGHATSYEYDGHNRLIKTTAPDGGVTRLVYTRAGQVEQVIDPRGLVTRYEHNGFGDVTKMISPDTGVTTYEAHDAAGRLLTERRNDGKVITYTWDGLGRLRSRQSGGAGEAFHYDEGEFGQGRLTSFTDATGRTDYRYNAAGQLVQQQNDIYGMKLTTSWHYDQAGRLASMAYPTGLIVSYHHDAAGRLAGITSNLDGAWSALADAASIT